MLRFSTGVKEEHCYLSLKEENTGRKVNGHFMRGDEENREDDREFTHPQSEAPARLQTQNFKDMICSWQLEFWKTIS